MDETPIVDGQNETPVETPTDAPAEDQACAKCAETGGHDEMAFAFLLALMPVVTLTLFGNMGLL